MGGHSHDMPCTSRLSWLAAEKGHMEKQEMEMKWKLETETGNWKQKWKRNRLAVVQS